MAPYRLWQKHGYSVTIASIKGGKVPVDPTSMAAPHATKEVRCPCDPEKQGQGLGAQRQLGNHGCVAMSSARIRLFGVKKSCKRYTSLKPSFTNHIRACPTTPPACSPRPQVEEFLLDGERDGGSRAVGWQE